MVFSGTERSWSMYRVTSYVLLAVWCIPLGVAWFVTSFILKGMEVVFSFSWSLESVPKSLSRKVTFTPNDASGVPSKDTVPAWLWCTPERPPRDPEFISLSPSRVHNTYSVSKYVLPEWLVVACLDIWPTLEWEQPAPWCPCRIFLPALFSWHPSDLIPTSCWPGPHT